MITPSQALATRASSPKSLSKREIPQHWSSVFQLSSFTAQTGGSFPESGIGAGDSWV